MHSEAKIYIIKFFKKHVMLKLAQMMLEASWLVLPAADHM